MLTSGKIGRAILNNYLKQLGGGNLSSQPASAIPVYQGLGLGMIM